MALNRRELLLAAGALAIGASDAVAMPARDAPWRTPAARRAGGAKPRALRELAGRVRGPVVRPGDGRYAVAARVYNARFDGARPDAVIEPLDSRDVQAVLRWADRHDVRVTARSGGHSYAGYSTLGEGVVVDLRRLDGIAVRRGESRAGIGAGARGSRSSTRLRATAAPCRSAPARRSGSAGWRSAAATGSPRAPGG